MCLLVMEAVIGFREVDDDEHNNSERRVVLFLRKKGFLNCSDRE